MKKLISLLLALVMIMGLTACTTKPKDETPAVDTVIPAGMFLLWMLMVMPFPVSM